MTDEKILTLYKCLKCGDKFPLAVQESGRVTAAPPSEHLNFITYHIEHCRNGVVPAPSDKGFITITETATGFPGRVIA